MASNEPIRVLVVEDDAAIREGVSAALTSEGYSVLAQADGRELQEAIGEFKPELAVLDIRLPHGHDGLELARQLRECGDIPIVFLTASDTVEQRLAGFAAGADDYLVKPFALEELLARIRALMRRSGSAGGVYRVGDLHVDEAARTVSRGRLLRLTKTEFEVLIVLLRNRGKVVHKELLLNEVWGYTGSPDLLQTHMSSLRRKLEEHGPRLIHTVHGVGYSLRPL